MLDSFQRSNFWAWWAFLLPFFLMGCRHLHQGHFEGNLQISSPVQHSSEPVGMDIVRVGPREKQVEIKNSKNQIVGQLLISKAAHGALLVTISQISAAPFLLQKSPSRDRIKSDVCFSHEGNWAIQFCFSDDDFYFKARSESADSEYLVYGNLSSPEGRSLAQNFPLETPTEVSLDEGIQRAMNYNFESREAFEKAYQAKMQATTAYLNLLPHLTISVLWYVSPTPISSVTGLFSVAPFFLPSAWLDAKKSSLDARVQLKAMKIFKADLIVAIETLFYEFARTEKIQSICEEFLEKLRVIRARLPSSQGQVESQEALNRIQGMLKQTLDHSKWVLEENRYALALALGFNNPVAIHKISLSQPITPEGFSVLDAESLGSDSLRRSIELSQLDLLLSSQRNRKVWLYFNWLDPAGDSRTALGANLFSEARLITSKTNEIKIRQEEAKAAIFNRAFEVALNFNTSHQFYLSTLERVKASEAHVKSFVALLGKGLSTDAEVIQALHHLQDWIAATLESEDHLRNFRIEGAKANRLLLTGHYSSFLF